MSSRSARKYIGHFSTVKKFKRNADVLDLSKVYLTATANKT